MNSLDKDQKEVINFFEKGEHSFEKILNQRLLINYIVLDQKCDEATEETGQYRHIVAQYLRQIYACLYVLYPNDRDLLSSCISELFDHDLG